MAFVFPVANVQPHLALAGLGCNEGGGADGGTNRGRLGGVSVPGCSPCSCAARSDPLPGRDGRGWLSPAKPAGPLVSHALATSAARAEGLEGLPFEWVAGGSGSCHGSREGLIPPSPAHQPFPALPLCPGEPGSAAGGNKHNHKQLPKKPVPLTRYPPGPLRVTAGGKLGDRCIRLQMPAGRVKRAV